jgi:hypothetical protein
MVRALQFPQSEEKAGASPKSSFQSGKMDTIPVEIGFKGKPVDTIRIGQMSIITQFIFYPDYYSNRACQSNGKAGYVQQCINL